MHARVRGACHSQPHLLCLWVHLMAGKQMCQSTIVQRCRACSINTLYDCRLAVHCTSADIQQLGSDKQREIHRQQALLDTRCNRQTQWGLHQSAGCYLFATAPRYIQDVHELMQRLSEPSGQPLSCPGFLCLQYHKQLLDRTDKSGYGKLPCLVTSRPMYTAWCMRCNKKVCR